MAFHSWIVFKDGTTGCIVQPPDYDGAMSTKDAAKLASKLTGKKVASAKSLPYAARPVLNREDTWPPGWAMTFCFQPDQCAGRSSCPRRLSCCD